jgi:hypothetical protein
VDSRTATVARGSYCLDGVVDATAAGTDGVESVVPAMKTLAATSVVAAIVSRHAR